MYRLIGLAAALAFAAPAVAAEQVYTFSGTVSNAAQLSAPIPQWSFASGQSFSGSLIYDTDRVTSVANYVTLPDWTLAFHYSPLVALEIVIDTATGPYRYSVPTQNLTGSAWQYAAVGAGTGVWSGIDLRTFNYPQGWTAGPPSVAVPASAYVGTYNPHSVNLFLAAFGGDVVADASTAPGDLTALFNAVGPTGTRMLDVRFSDSNAWTTGVERIDGIVSLQIDRFALSAVPEPQSWMMMIFGFGIVGAALRTGDRLRIRRAVA